MAERDRPQEREAGQVGEAFLGFDGVLEGDFMLSRAKGDADDVLVAAGIDRRDHEGLAHACKGGREFVLSKSDAGELVVGGEIHWVFRNDLVEKFGGSGMVAGVRVALREFFLQSRKRRLLFKSRLVEFDRAGRIAAGEIIIARSREDFRIVRTGLCRPIDQHEDFLPVALRNREL